MLEALLHGSLPNWGEAEVPVGAVAGKSKATQRQKRILDPAVLEERRKVRAARNAARRAATDPAVLEARRQAAAVRREARKVERQAAKWAAHLEKVRREWAEQQHRQLPQSMESETMVLGLPGPLHLQQFVQPSVVPAGPSLHPAFRVPPTRGAEVQEVRTATTDAQTQYTVQVVVKSAQAAVLPKVKSIALQTDNRVLGKNATGPRPGKSCKLIAPSCTIVSSTDKTTHRATRRSLRNST